jgi:protein involved in plasmid replication-relaxation
LTAGQLRELVFFEQASKTPLNRTLKRLTDGGYLVRLARMVGGFGGGSGAYVYQLGRVGWRYLGKGGGYRPLRVVDLHTLTIAECFVQLKRLEHDSQLTVITYIPEPALHRTLGDIPLTPDAYIELGVVLPQRRKFLYWLEVDRGTENADVIRGKLKRYWRAFKLWPDDDTYPYVVFVVEGNVRKRELERVIAGGPEAAHALFRVYLLDEFAARIYGDMQ